MKDDWRNPDVSGDILKAEKEIEEKYDRKRYDYFRADRVLSVCCLSDNVKPPVYGECPKCGEALVYKLIHNNSEYGRDIEYYSHDKNSPCDYEYARDKKDFWEKGWLGKIFG